MPHHPLSLNDIELNGRIVDYFQYNNISFRSLFIYLSLYHTHSLKLTK